MGRGKYKTGAEARQAREEAIRQASDLARDNQRLQGQLAELIHKHAGQLERRDARITELTEQLLADTSPSLIAKEAEVLALHQQIVRITETFERQTGEMEKLLHFLINHFVDEHGFGSDEARELALSIVGKAGVMRRHKSARTEEEEVRLSISKQRQVLRTSRRARTLLEEIATRRTISADEPREASLIRSPDPTPRPHDREP